MILRYFADQKLTTQRGEIDILVAGAVTRQVRPSPRQEGCLKSDHKYYPAHTLLLTSYGSSFPRTRVSLPEAIQAASKYPLQLPTRL